MAVHGKVMLVGVRVDIGTPVCLSLASVMVLGVTPYEPLTKGRIYVINASGEVVCALVGKTLNFGLTMLIFSAQRARRAEAEQAFSSKGRKIGLAGGKRGCVAASAAEFS